MSGELEFVLVRTHELISKIHHDQPGRDSDVGRAVDGQVARIQLVVKPGQCLQMGSHAGFRFERDENSTNGRCLKIRQCVQFSSFCGREQNVPLVDQSSERQGGLRRGLATGCAKYEVEALLAVLFEVPHLVVNPERDTPFLDVGNQQRTVAEQIEQHSPAADLRMPIAARMILPVVAVLVGFSRLTQGTYENVGTEHVTIIAELASKAKHEKSKQLWNGSNLRARRTLRLIR